MRTGAVPLLLEMVTSSTFLAGADLITRKAAYLALLRLLKFRLGVVGHSLLFTVVEAQLPMSNTKIRVLLSPIPAIMPPIIGDCPLIGVLGKMPPKCPLKTY